MTTNSYICRVPLSPRLGDYKAHQRIYEIAGDDDRPLFRRMHDHALVVSRAPIPGSQAKPYEPALCNGQEVRFLLRAEVSRSKAMKDEKRGKRYDPVLQVKNDAPHRDYHDIASEVGRSWLEMKGERHGFAISDLWRADYGPMSFVRPADRRKIRLAAIDMEGILQITDTEKFCSMLVTGIGRAKGFGLGLMLVMKI